MAGIFTVPAGQGFVDAVARGILARTPDPLALADITVILPGRRATHALRRAFLRATGGGATILPRMMPVGALDPDAAAFTAGDTPSVAAALDLPPPMPGVARHILLTRLVAAADTAIGLDQAARHAAALAHLLDEVAAEELGFDRLGRIVPQDHAAHWQQTLRFLEIVTRSWPALLAERGTIDPARHAARLVDALSAAWTAAAPAGPVLAAGFVGTTPAMRRLLAIIAALPQGSVLLPGLDRDLAETAWAAVDDTHPQHPLKLILDAVGCARAEVADWPAPSPSPAPASPDRAPLWREVMRPAATTEAWRSAEIPSQAVDGLLRVDCATAREEAEIAALALREALETPGRTACLVTPDRSLARRVAATLGRWGIEIDDSAGRPLGQTPIGTLLRLVADCALRDAAPTALLALLKHPLVALGTSDDAARDTARALELAALRGIAPGGGLEGLPAALPENAAPDLRAAVAALVDHLAPFHRAVAAASIAPAELLHRHLEAVEALAATADASGAARLWRDEEGEAAQALLAEMAAALDTLPAMRGGDWPALWEALAEGTMVRPWWGTHPRLAILGPLEARLERWDLTILGGLNEGHWPAPPPVDPWMSRPMRAEFGLPPPDLAIGRSAHDFVLAASGGAVMMTRAATVEGTPTVPSRWLMRLDAVLDGAGLRLDHAAAARWRSLTAALDAPDRTVPVTPPRPCPPVAVRPRRFSVSDVATLMLDPYALYARRVLRLKKLEEIELDPTAADRGTAIHDALAAFAKAYPTGPLPPDALDHLLDAGRRAFALHLPHRIEIDTFWWPRFRRLAEWFVAAEAELRTRRETVLFEQSGGLDIEAPFGPVSLTARADRIDRGADGRLIVVDYKTGAPPTAPQVAAGFAPQLPLEAAIAARGGFAPVPAGPVGALEYWRLTGAAVPGEIKVIAADGADIAEQALAGFSALIARFDDPSTPYLSEPRRTPPRFSDYGHLARVREWSTGDGEG